MRAQPDWTHDPCAAGRAAYERRDWAAAYALLGTAAAGGDLDPADIELTATVAYLVGEDAAGDEYRARSVGAWSSVGEPERAVVAACWLGMQLMLRGEQILGAAWFARAEEVLLPDDAAVGRGWQLMPRAFEVFGVRDLEQCVEKSAEMCDVGHRHGDADLVAFGHLGSGEAAVSQGRIDEGVRHLDEAMRGVTAGEASPLAAGIVYCAVIQSCHSVFDLRRAREWTSALSRWCERQPGLVAFRGACLVHRAEIMALNGAWPEAADEAERACEALAQTPAAGAAHYQLAEVHRLRGELAEAELCFQEAGRWIADPQPGLALLRLAQGRTDTAVAAIRRALSGSEAWADRARLLGPYVEIMAEAADGDAVRAGADELGRMAEQVAVPYVQAAAAHALAICRLVERDADGAARAARGAWSAWQDLDAPYETARARVLTAQAYRLAGEAESAEMELDAARWVFEQLGAATELRRIRSLRARSDAGDDQGVLTRREVEVLRLVAVGLTNKSIAAELFLSEKTVARHLSNIFGKLDVGSRAAATAYAYQHGLA